MAFNKHLSPGFNVLFLYSSDWFYSLSLSDISLFVYRHNYDTSYLLLYVDDIVLIASSLTLLAHIITLLSSEFSITDLGLVYHFLGITVLRDTSGLFFVSKTIYS
jgi:hypothetical protein